MVLEVFVVIMGFILVVLGVYCGGFGGFVVFWWVSCGFLVGFM